MKTRSLQLRLLLSAGIAVFVALAVAWFAMTWLFERHLERRVVADLMRDAKPLLANLALAPDDKPVAHNPPIDARFGVPDSGLYWQLSTPAGNVRSRSLWDQMLPTTHDARFDRWTQKTVLGPFGQRVLLLERLVRLNQRGPPVLVQLAHEEATLHLARDEFGRDLVLFLVVLWGVLCAAAWVQVRLGLRPLRRVRRELLALQRSPTARLGADRPREIQPLSQAIDDLAEAREQDLLRARRRAADLAHSLKTPLAALSAQSRVARRAGAVEAADGLDRAIAAVSATVEAELARARAAAARRSQGNATASPLQVAERIVGVVERTEAGARLVFEVDVPASLHLPVNGDDLMELLGALIENAARFARRRVRISARQGEDAVWLGVEDDGRGLDIGVERVGLHGGRLDEAGSGHDGLGMLIARDLTEATGGQIALDRSPLGGLLVSMRWSGCGEGPA